MTSRGFKNWLSHCSQSQASLTGCRRLTTTLQCLILCTSDFYTLNTCHQYFQDYRVGDVGGGSLVLRKIYGSKKHPMSSSSATFSFLVQEVKYLQGLKKHIHKTAQASLGSDDVASCALASFSKLNTENANRVSKIQAQTEKAKCWLNKQEWTIKMNWWGKMQISK